MKDSRTLLIKYYELKIKLLDDLTNNQKSYNSLLKQAQNEKNDTEEQRYYQIWANLVAKQLMAYQASEVILNTHIKDLGLDEEISQLLIQRQERQEEFKKRKILELQIK